MLVVLDSNEYIGGLGVPAYLPSVRLIERVVAGGVSIRIVRSIVQEVNRNLPHEDVRRLHLLLKELGVIVDEDAGVPFECVERYKRSGLKTGDAFIAAYTEWVGAKYLVSENRDFLALHPALLFEILRADQFLRKLGWKRSE